MQTDWITRYTELERELAALADRVRSALRELGDHKTTPERALLLLRLPSGPTSVADVAKRCYVGTNVSYNLAALAEAGLIGKSHPANDRRTVLIQRTPAGAELCRRIVEAMATAEARAAADAPADRIPA
jgi:DNA-binding MarR family transcriptional regulator